MNLFSKYSLVVGLALLCVIIGCGETEDPLHPIDINDKDFRTVAETKTPPVATVPAAPQAPPTDGTPFVRSVTYYTDWKLTEPITGTVSPGTTLFTKIVFSEPMTFTAADDKTARPILYYQIDGKRTRYRIAARGASGEAFESGDAKPKGSGTQTFVCKYTVPAETTGTFKTSVGKLSMDKEGNLLAGFYVHTDALRLAVPRSADIQLSEKVTPPMNREEILAFPGENATDEEYQRHAELVIAAAVNVNLLDISGCAPNPLVIEVGYGESIEIKNSDTTDHTLYHGGASITIPAGSSRGVVLTHFFGSTGGDGGSTGGDGFAGYGCDNAPAGIFYTNARLTVKPSERQRYTTFKVVEFLFPDGRKNPSLEGVKVTTLEGIEVTKKTASDGSATFKRDLPLTVRLEKEGYLTTEVTVTEADEEILLPSKEKDITFRVVEPLFPNEGDHPDWPDKRNGPGIEGVTVTCLEGSDEGVKETDADGSVSFFGVPPLTIRIEKPGYITTETVVVREEVAFPNEWPPEAEEAIRQLGLAEAIASGELILRWGDEEYLTALGKETGNEGLGGIISCSNIIVKKFQNRNFMVSILVHELMHARQGLLSTNPPCDVGSGWAPSEDGQAWIAALEKDLQEIGPIPDFDDRVYGGGPGGKLLSEIPYENQAMLYSRWYMGWHTAGGGIEADWDRVEELKKLYILAPNRCQYLEDRLGPPPPRQ